MLHAVPVDPQSSREFLVDVRAPADSLRHGRERDRTVRQARCSSVDSKRAEEGREYATPRENELSRQLDGETGVGVRRVGGVAMCVEGAAGLCSGFGDKCGRDGV